MIFSNRKTKFSFRKRSRKNSFRKVLALTLSVGLLLSTFTSCGKTDVLSSSERETIRFSWWGNDERHIYTMQGVDLFQKENPDIKVDVSYGVWTGYSTKMQIYMESHTEADVMQINYDWLSLYSADGEGFYDLNQLTDQLDLSGYDEQELSYGMMNGKLNAIPIAFNTLTFYYNQDLLDEYDLETPKTWDDLYDAADKLKKDDKYVLGIPAKQMALVFLSYFEQKNGKPFFNEDGSLNASKGEIEDLFQTYKDMIMSHVLMPIEQVSKTGYLSGEVAGTCAWVNNASNYMDELAQNGKRPVIGEYLRMKESDPLTGWYIKPATMYAIRKNSEHPEDAAKLVNFLVNDSDMALLQKAEKGVPASKHAMAALEAADETSSYEYMASTKMDEEKASMKKYIPVMEGDTYIDSFKQYTDSYVYGDGNLVKNVNEFYDALQAE